jgi:hypothetical protein
VLLWGDVVSQHVDDRPYEKNSLHTLSRHLFADASNVENPRDPRLDGIIQVR